MAVEAAVAHTAEGLELPGQVDSWFFLVQALAVQGQQGPVQTLSRGGMVVLAQVQAFFQGVEGPVALLRVEQGEQVGMVRLV